MKRRNHRTAISNAAAIAAVSAVALVGASAIYLAVVGDIGHPTTSASQPTIQGIVAGTVTVGPTQPVCSANQSCTEDLSGYALVFHSGCGTTSSTACQGQNFTAAIAPNGHYSILLAPGDYRITGLAPSCSWAGCSSSFPKSVAVVGGQQLIVNIDIDTGIR